MLFSKKLKDKSKQQPVATSNNNNNLRMTEQTANPTCVLCGKTCECPYGNNPYPLGEVEELIIKDLGKATDGRGVILLSHSQKKGLRCCDVCNVERVIPARIRLSCRGGQSKESFLASCREIVQKQITKIVQDEAVEILTYSNPYYLKDALKNQSVLTPEMLKLKEKVNEKLTDLEGECNEVLRLVMEYADQRFHRHLRIRGRTSPEDVCSTTSTLAFRLAVPIIKPILNDIKNLELRYNALIKQAETEVSQIVLDAPAQTSKTELKQQTEKERTKNANRKREQEKQQKKEQERQLALANAKRLQQQQQRAREIAKKKKQATLNALQKLVV